MKRLFGIACAVFLSCSQANAYYSPMFEANNESKLTSRYHEASLSGKDPGAVEEVTGHLKATLAQAKDLPEGARTLTLTIAGKIIFDDYCESYKLMRLPYKGKILYLSGVFGGGAQGIVDYILADETGKIIHTSEGSGSFSDVQSIMYDGEDIVFVFTDEYLQQSEYSKHKTALIYDGKNVKYKKIKKR